jgi:hypothetical protein
MVDQGSRAAEVEDGRDGHRGQSGPESDEGGLADDVDGEGFAAGGELEADADRVLPGVAVQEVVGESYVY